MARADMLIIVPSRGRPSNIARLLEAVHRLKQLNTHVVVGIDEDDETLPQYRAAFKKLHHSGDRLIELERLGLTEYTNYLAMTYGVGHYSCLASFGDDHLPVTPGFDRLLCRGIEDMGGTGFTYPWDGTREDIPEAVVMSADIVTALGWMCLPELQHYYVDNVWADLGNQAGCIRHLRAVAVDHVHPAAGKALSDATYVASAEKIEADKKAYADWRKYRAADDIRVVASLLERKMTAEARAI
jgi:hypothetical protein